MADGQLVLGKFAQEKGITWNTLETIVKQRAPVPYLSGYICQNWVFLPFFPFFLFFDKWLVSKDINKVMNNINT